MGFNWPAIIGADFLYLGGLLRCWPERFTKSVQISEYQLFARYPCYGVPNYIITAGFIKRTRAKALEAWLSRLIINFMNNLDHSVAKYSSITLY